LLFYFSESLAQIARVKDTPEVRELYLSELHILFRVLRPLVFPLANLCATQLGLVVIPSGARDPGSRHRWQNPE